MRVSQAVTKVRNALMSSEVPLTITDLRGQFVDLKASQLSMSLCYLIRAGWVTRSKVPSNLKRGHKEIWSYTYLTERLPKVKTDAISTEPANL